MNFKYLHVNCYRFQSGLYSIVLTYMYVYHITLHVFKHIIFKQVLNIFKHVLHFVFIFFVCSSDLFKQTKRALESGTYRSNLQPVKKGSCTFLCCYSHFMKCLFWQGLTNKGRSRKSGEQLQNYIVIGKTQSDMQTIYSIYGDGSKCIDRYLNI